MTLKLNINKETLSKINRLSDEMNIERDELIRKALKRYIFIAEMKNVRNRIRPKVKKLGFKTEDDIFRAVS